MKTQQNPQDNFDNAVMELVKSGIQAKRQAYGFSVTFHDESGNTEVECGLEHDGNISISVSTGVPPVHWFFRPEILAMAELLINAQERIIGNRSKTWLGALQDENVRYKTQEIS